MDDRTASIKRDLEDAKSNGADVDGFLAEANDIIAKAKKEAAAIREQAYKEAKEAIASFVKETEFKWRDLYNPVIKELLQASKNTGENQAAKA